MTIFKKLLKLKQKDYFVSFSPKRHKPEIFLDDIYSEYSDRKKRWYACRFDHFVDRYTKSGWRIL